MGGGHSENAGDKARTRRLFPKITSDFSGQIFFVIVLEKQLGNYFGEECFF
jgi:hypothetical protein